jgi:hypothetical protein
VYSSNGLHPFIHHSTVAIKRIASTSAFEHTAPIPLQRKEDQMSDFEDDGFSIASSASEEEYAPQAKVSEHNLLFWGERMLFDSDCC